MQRTHESLPEIALEWHQAGKGAALVTVMETWGSAPRQPGSQLLVSAAGEIMGSVSGGCVEGAAVIEAQAALADGQIRVLSYGVADETAFAAGLACGGTIRLLVEPIGAGGQRLPVALLTELIAARVARQAIAYAIDPETGQRQLIHPGEDALVDLQLQADRSGRTEDGRFVASHNPPLRLIIVGAVHIAQALVPMARLAGYAPVLVDPRSAFGAAARFPGEQILEDWPDAALASLGLDHRVAVVTLSHDGKIDDPAIMAALASDCFYLGCLGSGRTHAKRLDRLRHCGMTEVQLARIHAPVGLDIGAKTPAEIAVSILAQMTAVVRGQV